MSNTYRINFESVIADEYVKSKKSNVIKIENTSLISFIQTNDEKNIYHNNVYDKNTKKIVYAFLPRPEENAQIEPSHESFKMQFFDGVIIKIFPLNGKLVVTTGKGFNLKKQIINNKKFENLYNLLVDTIGMSLYKFLECLKNDNNTCYTYVLVHPENRINIGYSHKRFIKLAETNLTSGCITFNGGLIDTKDENFLEIFFDKNTKKVIKSVKHLSENFMDVKNIKSGSTDMRYIFLKNYASGSLETLYKHFPEHLETFVNMERQLESVQEYAVNLIFRNKEADNYDSKYDLVIKTIPEHVRTLVTKENHHSVFEFDILNKNEMSIVSKLLKFDIL
jgi:hypothetical protein